MTTPRESSEIVREALERLRAHNPQASSADAYTAQVAKHALEAMVAERASLRFNLREYQDRSKDMERERDAAITRAAHAEALVTQWEDRYFKLERAVGGRP